LVAQQRVVVISPVSTAINPAMPEHASGLPSTMGTQRTASFMFVSK
jgi:hypothetical protein